MSSFTLDTRRAYEVVDITDELVSRVPPDGDGFVLVYLKHTTAALAIGPTDDGMLRDFERVAERWLAALGPFEHNENNNANGPAHILSTFGGTQLFIPVDAGKLDLGKWQRVLLLELDGPQQRTVGVRVYQLSADGG